MITKDNKDLAQWAMEFALKNGCQQSKVKLYNGTSSSFEIRDMQVERLQQASENMLIVNFYVDGRFGSFSTNRLDKQELERYIPMNIEATRFLAEDRARTLPDESRYYKGGMPDLQLLDAGFDKITPEEKKAMALEACAEMCGKDAKVISAASAYGDERDFKYMITSNGFEGESSSSYFSIYANVSVKDQSEARPESYWFESSLLYKDLKNVGIGEKALSRALSKLGQRKIESGKYEMVVDNLNASQLLSPLMDAIDGVAIQQKNSFLMDRLNEPVMNSLFTLRDEPHLVGAYGARYFDEEGVATQPRTIFDKGVLNTFLIDTYRANKLKMDPTVASASILTMDRGEKDKEQLVSGIHRGILVTGFNGGNCNAATGNFSYGIEGFLIEEGCLVQPVSEMNITGNMIDLWNHLVEVGNDPRSCTSWRIPSLHFEDVDFSGI